MFHSLWICLSKEELSVTACNSFMVNFQGFFYSLYNLDFYIIFLCARLSTNIFSGYDLRTLQRKENWFLPYNSFIPKCAQWHFSLLENNEKICFISHLTKQLITVTVILLQFIRDFNIWHQKYFVVVKFFKFGNNCNLWQTPDFKKTILGMKNRMEK